MSSHTAHLSALTIALQHFVEARTAAFTAARKSLNIGELDARALLFIDTHPGARPTMLSNHLGITSAGVTTLIDRLIERGAVQREVDADDRRVNRITATVDLSTEPWSELTRFDRDVEVAARAADPATIEELAATLARLTEATLGGRP